MRRITCAIEGCSAVAPASDTLDETRRRALGMGWTVYGDAFYCPEHQAEAYAAWATSIGAKPGDRKNPRVGRRRDRR